MNVLAILGTIPYSTTEIFIYFVTINCMAFFAFGLDKYLARIEMWRISENVLLLTALIGGSFGAIVAQHSLRHKTRKQPFKGILYSIAVLQIILGGEMLALVMEKPDILLSLMPKPPTPVFAQHTLLYFSPGVRPAASCALKHALKFGEFSIRLQLLRHQCGRVHGFVVAAGAAEDDDHLAVGGKVTEGYG